MIFFFLYSVILSVRYLFSFNKEFEFVYNVDVGRSQRIVTEGTLEDKFQSHTRLCVKSILSNVSLKSLCREFLNMTAQRIYLLKCGTVAK